MEFKISLKNKDGEIIEYSTVDEEDYENINKYKWYLSNGYAQGSKGRLHRFILNAKKTDLSIDHINGNKLDNRKINLRFATSSQNSQNRPKKKNCSSTFIGVSYYKRDKNWKCTILKIATFFNNEEHAAYWYDQLAIKHYGINAKINGIEKPENFEEPFKKKTKILSTGVTLKGNKYQALIHHNNKQIYLGLYKTEQEAAQAYNKKKEEYEIEIERNNKEIERNIDNIAIIKTICNKEILVDDDKYHDLIKYFWNNKDDYTQTTINRKTVLMHRFLMNAKEEQIIDHINNNKLDNRLNNLRISDKSLNAHNRKKKENTTSKYIGVRKNGKKYQATITKDKIKYCLGSFNTEEDAAKIYNKKAIELYGTYAKLNFPDDYLVNNLY